MELKIDRIICHSFKGLRQKNLLLNNNNVIISGANGTGKSSVMAAWMWLMADCNENLVSNPNIFPIDAEEVSPSVEVYCTIDNKTVTLERKVKRTVKKSKIEGTADSVSFSSTYVVNGCEFGLRDFHKKLEEYGITDKFLTLSHTDSFLSEKKDDMRKVLFGMVGSITDIDIAKTMTGVDEATKLLETYTFDEISAMQNNTLRKVKEVYGKDGELLRAKMEGLENAKIDCDWSALELNKNLLKEKIAENLELQRSANAIEKELDELRDKNLELQLEISGLKSKAEFEKKAKYDALNKSRIEADEKANQLDRDISRLNNEMKICETVIERTDKEIGEYVEETKKVDAQVFDDNSLYCATCGQLLQLDKQEEIKKRFYANKEKAKNDLCEKYRTANELLVSKRLELADIQAKFMKAKNDRADVQNTLNTPLKTLTDVSDDTYAPQIAEIEGKIASLNNLMAEKKASLPNMNALKMDEINLNGELRDCEIQLGKVDLNNEIDEKIDLLRQQQIEFEQNKANAERILYQLSLIKQAKNIRLTDEINKHFKLVKWKLFDYQKNGEVKDVVVPTVDGKDLGVSLNNALVIRAKIDICIGLQNFYNEHYPIFLDNAESLDSENQALLDTDTQIIRLCVSDDKELTIKEG